MTTQDKLAFTNKKINELFLKNRTGFFWVINLLLAQYQIGLLYNIRLVNM